MTRTRRDRVADLDNAVGAAYRAVCGSGRDAEYNDAMRANTAGALFLFLSGLIALGCSSSDGSSTPDEDGGIDDTARSDQGLGTDTSSSLDVGTDARFDSSSGDTSSGGDTATTVDTATTSDADATTPSMPFVIGTNLSGAEFGTRADVYGKDYTYPTNAEIDYFTGKGMKVFRVNFLWERLQPALDTPLAAVELGRLRSLVSYISSKGAYTILDPHNYARYSDKIIGTSGAATAAQFGVFWRMLANEFKGDAHVIFGLMNEPHDMSTSLWLTDANTAIADIRKTGATNLILVPGNFWTGAHSWVGGASDSNSNVMLGIVDSGKNFAYEVHQYLDSDSSGTHTACVSKTIGSERLAAFTKWLTDHGARGFLGEFGGSSDATCIAAIDDILTYVDAHRAQYLGWTWWSAGPWWGDYMYSIEPTSSGADKPQLATLLKHK
jgi:endoglucanase